MFLVSLIVVIVVLSLLSTTFAPATNRNQSFLESVSDNTIFVITLLISNGIKT